MQAGAKYYSIRVYKSPEFAHKPSEQMCYSLTTQGDCAILIEFE